MPLLLSKPVNSISSYAIWNITETESQLLEIAEESPPVGQPNKRSEWIVTRILVSLLCKSYNIKYNGVSSLDTGKPVLKDSDVHISITHSFPMAAALINLEKPCGIDLEWPRQKLYLVKSKFLNSDEKDQAKNLDTLCKMWVAKEVLFKIYGRKNLSLKDDLQVKFENEWKILGRIHKNGTDSNHSILIENIQNYLLAYNI